jgi:nucleoside-diphosphate-sugar epimerase
MTGYHALIYGASGITGWAIVNQLLQKNANSDQFTRVTALTNRQLDHKDTLWPQSDKLLLTTANIMHEGGQKGLEDDLKSKVKDISTVTHVYFFGTQMGYLFQELELL